MLWANHKLRLIVTSDCNLDCFYCHNEGQPKSSDALPVELFQHLLRVIHRHGGLEIVTFSGGEPLLHPKLEYFVRELATVAEHRTIVTNGLLLDERRVNSLRRAGVTKFRIGIDSLTRASSRPSRVVPQGQSIHRTLVMLQKERAPYEINVVLTNFNRRELPGLLRFCWDHQVSAKFFEHVKTTSVRDGSGVTNAESQPYVGFMEFESCLRAVIPSLTGRPSRAFDGANEFYGSDGFSIRYCRYLCEYGICYLTGTRIDPRGFVYTCLVGNGRFRISPDQTVEESAALIRGAIQWGCSSRLVTVLPASA